MIMDVTYLSTYLYMDLYNLYNLQEFKSLDRRRISNVLIEKHVKLCFLLKRNSLANYNSEILYLAWSEVKLQ